MMKKTLCSIVLAATVGLSGIMAGCAKNKEFSTKGPTEELTGTVTYVDEDYFAYHFDKGVGNLVFEIVTVETPAGLRKVIALQPTEYSAGEQFSESVMVLDDGKVSLKEITGYLGYSESPLQQGTIKAYGIMERNGRE